MTAPFTFRTTPSIIFGEGSIARIGEVVGGILPHGQPTRRVLVVTDRGLNQSGLVQPVLAALERAGMAAAVHDGVTADPPEAVVMAAVAAGQAHGAGAILGFGGGSSLDVAKLAALLLQSGERLGDIYGVGQARGPRLPLVLVPTTAGTGSEVTPIAIVTTGDTEKKGVVSPVLLPDVAVLDPELTRGLPAHVTAATGIDAMVHAIEACTSTSPNNNPLSRALALEALGHLGRHIRRAVSHGTDATARSGMLLGSMLAGQAFANSPVGAVHALAYPIGGLFHVAHGLSNALVLPHVIRFNAGACGGDYARICAILFPETATLEAPVRAGLLGTKLAGLAGELGLPPRLRDVGIPLDAMPMLAGEAMKQTRLLVNNPRAVTRDDALAIYGAAW